MKRLAASLLSLFLLSGQTLLLPLHEVRVSQAEQGHHLAAPGAPSLSPADAHSHHEDADCRVCLGVVQSRLGAGPAAVVRSPAASVERLSAPAGRNAASLLLACAAPRGPPTVS